MVTSKVTEVTLTAEEVVEAVVAYLHFHELSAKRDDITVYGDGKASVRIVHTTEETAF